MSTTIPYNPSITLGAIINPEKLKVIEDISQMQSPIDAARDRMNSYISFIRSVEMTIDELRSMDVPTENLNKQKEIAKKELDKAGADFASTVLKNEPEIQKLKLQIRTVNSSIESPIDYVATQTKKLPLAANSIKLDAQYFSFDGNEQSVSNTIAQMKSFVSASAGELGMSMATEMARSASAQVNMQHQAHGLKGSLVITATCTHKDAVVFAPLVLDVDKAVRVWNSVFTDDSKKLRFNDPKLMFKIAFEEGTSSEDFLPIVSGATFGSSFVGMVHFLKNDNTEEQQVMLSTASKLQAQIDAGLFFTNATGGFGLDTSFSEDVKHLLSMQSISSHVSVISMGCIPSIKSNELKIGVKEFADFDPKKMMDNLATLANATIAEQKSVKSGAETARIGAQLINIENMKVQSVMTGLANIEDGKNKLLNINSLMTAFESYIAKAESGDAGIPINYQIKNITRAQLAQLWVHKYLPNRYLDLVDPQPKNSDPSDKKNETDENENKSKDNSSENSENNKGDEGSSNTGF